MFAIAPGESSAVAGPFQPDTVGFQLHVADIQSTYRILGLFLLPQERVTLQVDSAAARGRCLLRFGADTLTAAEPGVWHWSAPRAPGLCTLVIRAGASDSMILNVFVMVPFAELKGEYLNGYRMGRYPLKPYRNLAVYKPPRGFIEVTARNNATHVSPHFTLGQFLCKQEGGYPKYVALREALLLKLELILSEVNRRGYACSSFAILSGYRTPYYNHAIGNVKYSRHQWGGAADIFIDQRPADGMMDDLNRDGRIDWRDAAILYDVVDDMYGEPYYERFIGGLGRYGKTARHGPFVHVDVRGFRARWGD